MEKDKTFIERFSHMIRENFEDISVFVFPGIKKAETAAAEMHLDALLIDASFNCKSIEKNIPEQCRIAILTDSYISDNQASSGLAVCKYQGIEQWQKFFDLLNTGTSPASQGGEPKGVGGKSKLCLFCSAIGCAGTTLSAVAFGTYLSIKGKSVLYISAETINSVERSCKTCDTVQKSGMEYDYLDSDFCMTGEKDGEYIAEFCREKASLNKYDLLILDMNFAVPEAIVLPFINAERLVLVLSGEDGASYKTRRLMTIIPKLSGVSSNDFYKKALLLYNKFDENGNILRHEDSMIKRLGGIRRRAGNPDFEELITDVLKEDYEVFDRLADELDV